jgi:hypothetical protein
MNIFFTLMHGSANRHLYGVRATLSRLLVMFLGVTACLAVAMYVFLSTSVGYVADGEIVEALQFQIVDSTTESPIAGAIVAIWDSRRMGLESPPRAIGENATKGATDEKGLVTVECCLPCSSHHQGLSSNQVVSIPDGFWVAVDLAGYDPKRVPLNELVGRRRRPVDWPLAPIRVALSIQIQGQNTSNGKIGRLESGR